MSGSYGFGLSSMLPRDISAKQRDELLMDFGSLGLTSVFHVIVDGNVVRVAGEKGAATLVKLTDAEAAPILSACNALGMTPDGTIDEASWDDLMRFSNYGDLLLTDLQVDHDDENLIELEFPDSELDGLAVGSVDEMLEDLTAELASRTTAPIADEEEQAAGAASDADDEAQDAAALEDERQSEARFAQKLAAALELCRTHKLLIGWSPEKP